MGKCFGDDCKLDELNIGAIASVLGGADISKIDRENNDIVLSVHRGTLIDNIPVEVLQNYLQEANPGVEIIYDDSTIDEITQKKDKPLWVFSKSGTTLELKRVVGDEDNN